MVKIKIFDMTFIDVLFKKGKKLREVISVCYLSNLVEFSTFFAGQRVAKASTGLIPLPFLITLFNTFMN
jgi:hypothetical protein